MQDLKIWEEKIKNKAYKTDFREFLKSVGSWQGANFYKTNGNISIYPKSERIGNLVSPGDFEKNIDKLTDYGFDYNFENNFFENYSELLKRVPIMSTRLIPPSLNSDYSEISGWGIKNCYLCIGAVIDSENILYSFEVKENCRNIFNSVMVWDTCENVYQSNSILKSSNIFFSRFILNSSNIYFSTNLVGCNNCMFCDSLENKSYCIKNKEYTKEEYKKELENILKFKHLFYHWYEEQLTSKGKNLVSKNTTGSYITNSEDVENGYYSYNIKNGKNVILTGAKDGNKNMFNVIMSGAPNLDDCFNVINSGWGGNIYCSDTIAEGQSIYYSYLLQNCSFCIGCIGLKNKSYCILNKEYSKEEWYELANKIFAQMDKTGILGDFFPGNINPFYFNDTMAYLIDQSFTKEEVGKDGYMWREDEIKVDIPEGNELIEIKNLKNFEGYDENGKWFIKPEILKKVIKDGNGNVYRIVSLEYDFLMKHSLPLPEIHWMDRIKLGFKF